MGVNITAKIRTVWILLSKNRPSEISVLKADYQKSSFRKQTMQQSRPLFQTEKRREIYLRIVIASISEHLQIGTFSFITSRIHILRYLNGVGVCNLYVPTPAVAQYLFSGRRFLWSVSERGFVMVYFRNGKSEWFVFEVVT